MKKTLSIEFCNFNALKLQKNAFFYKISIICES